MINLPAGTVVKTGVDVAAIDFRALLHELKQKLFNGYICISIQGKNGLEDGSLVFDSGKIVAAFYEYLMHHKDMVGDAAFIRVVNASMARTGLIDIYQLSNDQVQLILAFNENAICLPSENDLRKLQFPSFSEELEVQAVGSLLVENKDSLLRKYKLADISMESPPDTSHSDISSPLPFEEDLLKGLPKPQKRR
ncbi:DUF2226 domain-containing protein [Candidatus Micrarchaeota archaeon]|nr:DUF2226 domain-containing protein [Candidatus Micrarchaeota archaeon]